MRLLFLSFIYSDLIRIKQANTEYFISQKKKSVVISNKEFPLTFKREPSSPENKAVFLYINDSFKGLKTNSMNQVIEDDGPDELIFSSIGNGKYKILKGDLCLSTASDGISLAFENCNGKETQIFSVIKMRLNGSTKGKYDSHLANMDMIHVVRRHKHGKHKRHVGKHHHIIQDDDSMEGYDDSEYINDHPQEEVLDIDCHHYDLDP